MTVDGEKYIVYGGAATVDTTLLGDKMRGSINSHNHVTGKSQYSFSYQDLLTAVADGSKEIHAFDEKFRYTLKFNGNVISAENMYKAYSEAEYEVNKAKFDNYYGFVEEYIADDDLQNEIIRKTAYKLKLYYTREKR
ncbi:hypothetical protein FACS189499_10600 [Clostridia bacterium]|nr:hypothetical protein FACS189499_10600 [Clostridia bacterium]